MCSVMSTDRGCWGHQAISTAPAPPPPAQAAEPWGTLEQSCTLREHRIEKSRALALSSQGAAQKVDFKEPRLFPLPGTESPKFINVSFLVLISDNLLMVWLPGFCCKCIYILTPPFPFQSSFSELTETLSSRFVCAWPLSHVRLLWPNGL